MENFKILPAIIGILSVAVLCATLMILWIPKLRWKFGSTDTRFSILRKKATSPSLGFSRFSVIADNTVNNVLDACGKYDPENRVYNPPLERHEYLFAGYQMHNFLIVRFLFYRPSISHYTAIEKRIKDVPERYPRLRHVYIIDEKDQAQKHIRDFIKKAGGTIFYLKDFDKPETLIIELSKIKVLPKDHPEILVDNKGAGI